jgi:cytochrome c oxidase subunit II
MSQRVAHVVAFALPGYAGSQSTLDPHGPAALAVYKLFWIFVGISAVVWIVVAAALAHAVMRGRPERLDPLAVDQVADRQAIRAVAIALGITAVILVGLTGTSYVAQKALTSPTDAPIVLRVRGHQWWWEVTYEDQRPDRILKTANEIHIPVGVPVLLSLSSSDVIHSFWVPNLAGKQDLVPGQENQLRLLAERPGSFRGQCAEFCGVQHAKMALLIIAQPAEDFENWRKEQLAERQRPDDADRRRGEEVFSGGSCALCHTVRGTRAAGTVGPDLTHLASRKFIAAGTLENTRGNLAAWMLDPQTIKPGAHMPVIPLAPDDVHPLLSFLAGLE